jgi:RNA polymerase sigma-70 factor, ECF subfamily
MRRFDSRRAAEHLDRVYAAAWACSRDPDTAQDLAQEAYAAALARPRWLTSGDELAYLVQAVRNRWNDELRRRARQPVCALDSAAEPWAPAARQPHRMAEHAEVLRVIDDLPAPMRDAVLSVDVAGLSYAEAATFLRVPVGTVMSRLSRARDRVVATLEGGGPAAGAAPA